MVEEVVKGVLTEVDIGFIEDNPYNPRKYYNSDTVKALAASIESVGLLEKPEARKVGDKYQIAYGGYRLRAFRRLCKDKPDKWSAMPLYIREIDDREMALIAMHENLNRTDLKPIELARSVDNFFKAFPEEKETNLARSLNTTQSTISNYRRVLILPQDILDKIDDGRINFTMARDLLVLQGIQGYKKEYENGSYVDVAMSDLEMMNDVIYHCTESGHVYPSFPCTVEGVKKSITYTASKCLKPLKNYNDIPNAYNMENIVFDAIESGCISCDKMFLSHIGKDSFHWCTDPECWKKKNQEAKDKVAAEAKARIEREALQVLNRMPAELPAENISQEISEEEKADEGILPEDEKDLLQEEMETSEPDTKEQEEDYGGEGEEGITKSIHSRMIPPPSGSDNVPQLTPEEQEEVKQKLGTRAIAVDLKDMLSNEFTELGHLIDGDLIDGEECETCTKGFHFAFDTRRNNGIVEQGKTIKICTNMKCIGKKKGEKTREKNVDGQVAKKAEEKAVKVALEQIRSLTLNGVDILNKSIEVPGAAMVTSEAFLHLILYTLIHSHLTHEEYSTGKLSPKSWLHQELKLDEKEKWNTRWETLFPEIRKLGKPELAVLVVKCLLYYLQYHGKLINYRQFLVEPLALLGVKVGEE